MSEENTEVGVVGTVVPATRKVRSSFTMDSELFAKVKSKAEAEKKSVSLVIEEALALLLSQ